MTTATTIRNLDLTLTGLQVDVLWDTLTAVIDAALEETLAGGMVSIDTGDPDTDRERLLEMLLGLVSILEQTEPTPDQNAKIDAWTDRLYELT